MQGFMPTLPIEVEALGKLLPPYSLLLLFHVSGKAVSTCQWKKQAESVFTPRRNLQTMGLGAKLHVFLAAILPFMQKKASLCITNQRWKRANSVQSYWDLSSSLQQGAELFSWAAGCCLLTVCVT